MMMKLQVLCFITFLGIAFVAPNITMIKAAEKEPDLWVKIYRIQLIDSIEGFGEGEADWHYYLTLFNGEEWSYIDEGYSEDDDIIVNDIYTFKIKDISVRIYLHLLDTDYWTAPDLADISSHKGGGEKNYDEITIGAQYRGTYDLLTNTLTGDSVITESGYFITSGELDGGEDEDEYDAALWFSVWDNYDPPIADAGPDQQCLTGEKLYFNGYDSSASEGSSIVTYKWDFDDDGIIDATGAKTSFLFEEKGTYIVSLTVTDSIGEIHADTCTVKVRGREPTASFTYSPTKPTIRDKVYFNDTSEDLDGTIVSRSWDFGDGATATGQYPSHQYSDKGYFIVTITVTDNDDNANSTKKVVVIKNLAPAADFTYSPSSPKVSQDIQFTDQSTDPEGKELEYLWDFGDGYTSTQRNPLHKYTSPGSKNVELTIKDDEGAENSTIKSIAIMPNVPPTAKFSYSPENQKMNNDVQFNDESTDPDGQVVERLWDFGDGVTSTQEKPIHRFKEGGEYSVKLTATDDGGDSDEIINKVNILQTFALTLQLKDALGLNIANANIELFIDGECYSSGSTDKKGKLNFAEIAEGNYEIRIKVLGAKTSKTCSLTESKTEDIRVAFSFNTVGLIAAVIVIAAILIFYIIRTGKI